MDELPNIPPIMVDCECAGMEGAFVETPVLAGAPSGWICRACGEFVKCDLDRMTKPHKRPDILAMIDRGDFG